VNRFKTIAATVVVGASLVTMGLSSHAAFSAATTTPAIPRCVNDDFNDGSQARCWTETTKHHVLVIDRKDRVISDRH
jgi:hypothetical protein